MRSSCFRFTNCSPDLARQSIQKFQCAFRFLRRLHMKYSRLGGLGVCGAALLLGGLALGSLPNGGYHLLKKYELGPAPGGKEYWDYITFDASTHRLFISHNTEVKVVNADSGAIVGNIPELKRVHGIALIPGLGRGFITDRGPAASVLFH